MRRPAIIITCSLLLATYAVAESVEVTTLEAQESSCHVLIAVGLDGKPLKNG
jgi:hypothetical protein